MTLVTSVLVMQRRSVSSVHGSNGSDGCLLLHGGGVAGGAGVARGAGDAANTVHVHVSHPVGKGVVDFSLGPGTVVAQNLLDVFPEGEKLSARRSHKMSGVLVASCIRALLPDHRLVFEQTNQTAVFLGLSVHFLFLFLQFLPLLLLLGNLLNEILLSFLQLLQDRSGPLDTQ